MKKTLLLITSLALTTLAFTQNTATLGVLKDNTLFEDANGDLSSGNGTFLFSGRTGSTGNEELRRAVIAFDLNDIPAVIPENTLVIKKVTLKLTMEQGKGTASSMSLHKLTSDWGEGASISPGGQGTQAQNNDATWVHTFYNSQMWTTPGGDYESTASATTSVGTTATTYEWTSEQMKTDLENWINNPTTNFGWILIGDETSQSAKKFGSKEHSNEAMRPQLEIEYNILASTDKLISADISIYPNPTARDINISINQNISKADVEIVDLLGKVVYKTTMGSSATISIADKPKGFYYVIIKSEYGVITKKITKL